MDKKLHLVGNAHLDPVWLWRWQEGFAEIKATFQSALDRMNEFPEFIFTSACAAYYQWVEENCPEMFAEITVRVQEGRWVIVGGWWIQPDCNIPSGESFARHGLYSQRYFLEKFGRTARAGYNVDSFGHNGMLPQILKKSGMDYYVFHRPGSQEKDLPENLFWWESMDGSRVLAFRIPFGYGTNWHDPEDVEVKCQKTLTTMDDHEMNTMLFYGVGNHGGGPTISNLKNIRGIQQKWQDVQVFHSSPNQYFDEMAAKAMELPVLRDDLQHHASGCYATHSETKKKNRRAEHRLLMAEKFLSIAHRLTGIRYEGDKLRKAWQNVLFNQFHDIMGGCSIQEAYEDAGEFYGESLKIAGDILNASLQKISWAIDTSKGMQPLRLSKEMDGELWEADDRGIPLVVFNSLSWDVQPAVQVNKNVKTIADDKGNALEIQSIRGPQTNGTDDKWDTLFIGDIPAMGYRVYWIYKEITRAVVTSGEALLSEGTTMDNQWLRLEIDPATGAIKQLYDKERCLDVFSESAAVAVVIDESDSDTWAHGIFSFRNEVGRFGSAEVKVIENGPVRTIIRAVSSYNRSTLRQDYILYRHKKEVVVRVRVDWQEEHKLLKLSFPVAVTQSEVTYEIPYGHITRPANGEEEPGQQWVDVSGVLPGDKSRRTGLALLNDCKYSFDVMDNDLRMTVVRSPLFADHYGDRDEFCEFMDQGVHTFSYALVPHTGDWKKAGIPQKACELNVSPQMVVETYHQGQLPRQMKGLNISQDNIIAVSLKRAEDGGAYILRCYETAASAVTATIEIPILGRRWRADFSPCEIKTFTVPDDNCLDVYETNILELQKQAGIL